ncbi:hypothetical protein quinque_004511 [Culex quinquefasciatus]
MSTIKLETSDGVKFTVKTQVAKCSGTIRTMLEDIGINPQDGEAIPLSNVHSTILQKILVWAEHHVDDPEPPRDDADAAKRTDDICSWDEDFLKVDQRTLFDVMLAANYLDMKQLIAVCCKTVANMIKGKTADQIRKTFNIENDFPPGEEDKIRLRNQFCEERRQF